jgi:hypothetical protein
MGSPPAFEFAEWGDKRLKVALVPLGRGNVAFAPPSRGKATLVPPVEVRLGTEVEDGADGQHQQ